MVYLILSKMHKHIRRLASLSKDLMLEQNKKAVNRQLTDGSMHGVQRRDLEALLKHAGTKGYQEQQKLLLNKENIGLGYSKLSLR